MAPHRQGDSTRRRTVTPVVDGVFFTRPTPLPRGPHDLDHARVTAVHRERFMIAFTELVAAHGYAAVRVADLCARASTSKSAFYTCFRTVEECALAAYGRFVDVLLANLAEVDAVLDGDEAVEALLNTYLRTLQSDLAVARAFQLELHNEGRFGRAQRRRSLALFAELVRKAHRSRADTDSSMIGDLPFEAYLGIIYAVRQLASDLLDADDPPDLMSLSERLAPWLRASLRA